jgi:hypothetical protein
VFGRVLRGRTAILITHRMSLVERADMVVVLDQGDKAEVGISMRIRWMIWWSLWTDRGGHTHGAPQIRSVALGMTKKET